MNLREKVNIHLFSVVRWYYATNNNPCKKGITWENAETFSTNINCLTLTDYWFIVVLNQPEKKTSNYTKNTPPQTHNSYFQRKKNTHTKKKTLFSTTSTSTITKNHPTSPSHLFVVFSFRIPWSPFFFGPSGLILLAMRYIGVEALMVVTSKVSKW